MEITRIPIVFSAPAFQAPPAFRMPDALAQGLAQSLAQNVAQGVAQRVLRGSVVNGPLNWSSKRPFVAMAQQRTFTRPEPSHPLNGRNLSGINVGKIGAGVGGEVCLFKIEGEEYIVKSMHGEAERAMFEKEAAAFRRLKPHENICAPVAFANVNGRPSMLFKSNTMPTTTIAERASSLPPNDQLAVLEVCARDVLRGLKFMHEHDMAHGDVKCDNTVVDEKTLQIKIIDLGHSTAASADDPRSGKEVLKRRSGRSGDRRFTPPELDRPELGNKNLAVPATLQSIDVFAVGRMLQDWLKHADARFEKVHGGPASARMAAGDPDVGRWMERRKRLGDVAAQMLDNDPGKRPLVAAALEALTPASRAERVAGRKVLGQLVAVDTADKTGKPAENAGKAAEAGKAGKAADAG